MKKNSMKSDKSAEQAENELSAKKVADAQKLLADESKKNIEEGAKEIQAVLEKRNLKYIQVGFIPVGDQHLEVNMQALVNIKQDIKLIPQ